MALATNAEYSGDARHVDVSGQHRLNVGATGNVPFPRLQLQGARRLAAEAEECTVLRRENDGVAFHRLLAHSGVLRQRERIDEFLPTLG